MSDSVRHAEKVMELREALRTTQLELCREISARLAEADEHTGRSASGSCADLRSAVTDVYLEMALMIYSLEEAIDRGVLRV